MPAARSLTAAVVKDDGWFVARCLQVEVASQGETVDEALDNLREALELFFEDEEVPTSFVHPLVTSIEVDIAHGAEADTEPPSPTARGDLLDRASHWELLAELARRLARVGDRAADLPQGSLVRPRSDAAGTGGRGAAMDADEDAQTA